VNHGLALAVAIWAACALLGTCTLGVVALERAAVPVRAPARSGAAVALIERAAGTLAAESLGFWEQGARAAGLRPERVVAAQLYELPVERFGVWLLAGNERLSDADWAALDAFALRGGGLIVVGPSGEGALELAAGDELAPRRIFPANRFELCSAAPAALGVGSRGPIGAGIAPDREIPLVGAGAHFATSKGGALVWSGEPGSGAALAGLYRGSPAVWFGCATEWLSEAPEAQQLAVNALRFASREPLIDVRMPDGEAAGDLRAELEAVREGELEVHAHNAGARAAGAVTLRVYLPPGALRPAVRKSSWLAARPLVRYASGHAWLELEIAELEPGASVRYTLLF
jgi:hypothetical protein